MEIQLGINATKFGSEVYPDADGLNRLVNNDIWLSDVMPRVIIRYPNGVQVKTSESEKTRIAGGMVRVSKKFKGSSDVIEIKLPAAPKPGPPIFTMTIQSKYPCVGYIVGWTPGYRSAKVRLTLLDKTKQTTAIIYWQAIMGV